MAELASRASAPIDIVVVNVAPFAPAVGAQLVGIDEAIEMIDVGGAALLGAAARNGAGVAAVGSPEHYPKLVAELKRHHAVSAELRAKLAADAFGIVAAYYAEIAAYLNLISNTTFPNRLAVVLEKVDDLRYGENPHQRAAFYRETTHRSGTLADATQLRGDRPSFNNYLDLDTAYRIARDFTTPTVAIVKHTDPVGRRVVGRARRGLPPRARDRLRSPRSAGSSASIASWTERPPARSRRTATRRSSRPAYSQAALGILKPKAGLEILAVPPDPTEGMRDYGIANLDFKRVAGGLLVESIDQVGLDRGRLQVVTRRRPTLDELNDLLFAWRTVCHVRSNAIVLARNGATIGIGAAQASRQVSVEIALRRAGDRAKTAVMASDAYFPFPDGIQMAARPGSRRSSSRAARSATRWRSRSPTGTTWRWSSRERRHFRH